MEVELEFKPRFSTQETWKMTRASGVQCAWGRSVWFGQATPKFAFMTWLALQNRLATMDRISTWSQGVDPTCVMCKNATETRNHIFFECPYSAQLWEHLMKGILQRSFTVRWEDLLSFLMDSTMEKKKLFCFRYTFQAAVYSLWRERNQRRHGEPGLPISVIPPIIVDRK